VTPRSHTHGHSGGQDGSPRLTCACGTGLFRRSGGRAPQARDLEDLREVIRAEDGCAKIAEEEAPVKKKYFWDLDD
jgi:hypothetical protein